MKKREALLLIILSSMLLNSCTLRLDYYLINNNDFPIQFEIYDFHIKELGFYEFRSSLNNIGKLKNESYEKFDSMIHAKTSKNDNIILGEIPANTVMYLGFGIGVKRLFDKILLDKRGDEYGIVRYENLEKKGRVVHYTIQ